MLRSSCRICKKVSTWKHADYFSTWQTQKSWGKVRPENKDSTRLQKLSFLNKTYFGAVQYDFHLDVKLYDTITRIFQEKSFSELETLHHLDEFERTQIRQSLALAVLKKTYAGYILSGNCSNFIDYEENIPCYYTWTKKFRRFKFLIIKDAMNVYL